MYVYLGNFDRYLLRKCDESSQQFRDVSPGLVVGSVQCAEAYLTDVL